MAWWHILGIFTECFGELSWFLVTIYKYYSLPNFGKVHIEKPYQPLCFLKFEKSCKFIAKKNSNWTFLVVQRNRICPPMQVTQVRSLAWGDSTCRG